MTTPVGVPSPCRGIGRSTTTASPIYTNSQYLFKPPRPSRATTIPFEFWVNGQNAGLSKGSRNPAEFEVGPLLRSGRNLLAVKELR